MQRGSVLLIAPLFSAAPPGGLQIATIDLARELERRGWDLTVVTMRDPPPAALLRGATLPVLGAAGPPMDRGTPLPDRVHSTTAWLPVGVAHRFWRLAPLLGRGVGYLRTHSSNLATIERLLASAGQWQIVVLVDYPPMPGIAALVADRHQRMALLSLSALPIELRHRYWRMASAVARLVLRDQAHPYLFRPIRADRLTHVVFASAAWRDHAVAAGVSAAAAHTIYFGSAWPDEAPQPTSPSSALIFIGRLAPDKGLHVILRGFARLHARRPEVTLTIVGAPGRAWYRYYCQRLARRLGVDRALRWHPPVPRDALSAICRSHAALLFYSENAEPVALCLLDAAAAGLPVVSSRPASAGPIVIDGDTCICYDPRDPESLASAVQRVLDDVPLRGRLVTRIHAATRHVCSLEAMGDEWDRLLQTLLPT